MNTETLSYRRLFFVLCVIWFALNATVLLGYRALPWDAIDEFYPTVYFNAHSLRLGLAPWWNPYIYSGTPAIADPQGMMFSPLLMAWMLLKKSPGPVWFDWGVLLHLLMGGAAMLGVLRRYRANAVGALLGAMVFMAGGVAASRLEHTPIVVAYAYVPVVMLSLQCFLASPTLRGGCLVGIAAGVMAANLVQVTYLFVLMFVAYAIVGTSARWAAYTKKDRLCWLVGMVLAGGIAAVIAVPQLLFSSAFMAISNRTAVPLDAAGGASLDLRAFLIMLAPNVYHTFQGGGFTGPVDFIESYMYIGIIPLLMLALLWRAWQQPVNRGPLAFFAVVGVFSTLYMMGIHTRFYPWLYSWLPGLTHFRRPADAAYLVNYVFAIGVGICASQLNLQSRREPVVILAVAAIWLALAAVQMHDPHGLPLLAAAAAVVALWGVWKKQGVWRVAVWLSLVLAVDYACYNLNGHFNETDISHVSRFHARPSARYLTSHLDDVDGGLSYRFTTHAADPVWDNGGMLLGVASTQGYNPLRLDTYAELYKPRQSSNDPNPENPLNAAPTYTLDRLLSVRLVVVGHRKDVPAWSPPSDYAHVYSDGDVDIWRNDGAYPRVLTPRKVIQLRINEVPDPAAFNATDFRDVMWLTPRDERDAEGAKVSACSGKAAVMAYATLTKTTITTRADSPGWIVLGDLDAPGWRASIDGKNVPIHRANVLFRAVCVPAGTHQLIFAFHPMLMISDALARR
ncbi:YfhO family protein [Rhodanobacter sp. DHG33]|uniref:YfhO family protein n=1 Tax=Rhodanobacter sp. DHG33 TaxID=2775921 RepID=UPI001783A9A3|nr:YfhO family protein [Rhodanobacter sp. DHG33]MBD8897668.1 YfhO family protein [Rhodanobacter sp. DHG33]